MSTPQALSRCLFPAMSWVFASSSHGQPLQHSLRCGRRGATVCLLSRRGQQDIPNFPSKKSGEQEAEGRVRHDGSVAGACRTPGRPILEACSCTSSPATPLSPLPPLLLRVPMLAMDWAAFVVSPCYAASGGRKNIVLSSSLRKALPKSVARFPLGQGLG